MSSFSNINLLLLDGNMSLQDVNIEQAEAELNSGQPIPVYISEFRNEHPIIHPKRAPIRKTIKRNNLILQSINLPVIMNLNPRSIYNKTDEFYQLLDRYEADLICISESWERENLPLDQLLSLENFKDITIYNPLKDK